MEECMNTYEKVVFKGISQPIHKINAVYIEDDGLLTRNPVIAIILFDSVLMDNETKKISEASSGIKYLEFNEGLHEPIDLENAPNLLGYEVEGKESNWEEEIKSYILKRP